MVTFGKPLLFTIVFKFKNSWRYNSVDDWRADLFFILDLSIKFDIDKHSQEEEIFVEGELILHLIDFWKYLEDHES